MPWYAVYTRSRFEDKVYNLLSQKSIQAFLPKIEVWSRRKDRKKRIMIPMFSSYLFVDVPHLKGEEQIRVLKTPGVVRILNNPDAGEPAPIPDRQIEAIQRLICSRVEIETCLYPTVGEKAMIIDGPFKGIEGIVKRTDYRKNIFVISIDLLMRSVSIKLEGFQIEKI
ncbi:MAG: UpxY family transcription antiterminator [Deltaproteobacteria bacterium]|nr:UpxY family transcription antiterminator [Deltaproteobacteria bacterium]